MPKFVTYPDYVSVEKVVRGMPLWSQEVIGKAAGLAVSYMKEGIPFWVVHSGEFHAVSNALLDSGHDKGSTVMAYIVVMTKTAKQLRNIDKERDSESLGERTSVRSFLEALPSDVHEGVEEAKRKVEEVWVKGIERNMLESNEFINVSRAIDICGTEMGIKIMAVIVACLSSVPAAVE